MNTLRTVAESLDTVRLRRLFWVASAMRSPQIRYHVEDLGTLHDGFFGCTMGVNNHGWTETQYGLLESGEASKRDGWR